LLNAVDIEQTAAAYARLANDAALRAELGANAISQARRTFDWQIIIPQYEELWHELSVLRKGALELTARRSECINPMRDDPTRLFKSYSTHHMDSGTIVQCTPTGTPETLAQLTKLSMNRLAPGLALPPDQLLELLSAIGTKPLPLSALLSRFSRHRPQHIELSLLHLAKMGMVGLTTPKV
jgi:alpha-maltose-1-phosphate synthase